MGIPSAGRRFEEGNGTPDGKEAALAAEEGGGEERRRGGGGRGGRGEAWGSRRPPGTVMGEAAKRALSVAQKAGEQSSPARPATTSAAAGRKGAETEAAPYGGENEGSGGGRSEGAEGLALRLRRRPYVRPTSTTAAAEEEEEEQEDTPCKASLDNRVATVLVGIAVHDAPPPPPPPSSHGRDIGYAWLRLNICKRAVLVAPPPEAGS